jgi:hypothetical protein
LLGPVIESSATFPGFLDSLEKMFLIAKEAMKAGRGRRKAPLGFEVLKERIIGPSFEQNLYRTTFAR